jgi:hypothetical protein
MTDEERLEEARESEPDAAATEPEAPETDDEPDFELHGQYFDAPSS